MQVIIPESVGYCHGVKTTVSLAEKALKIAFNNCLPCYCLGELIHNPDVIRSFQKRGLKIIKVSENLLDDLSSDVSNQVSKCHINNNISNSNTSGEEITKNINKEDINTKSKGVVLISAHGATNKIKKDVLENGYVLMDSTCVNIKKTQEKMRNAYEANRAIIVIGVQNHAETVTLMGTLDYEEVYLVSDDSTLDTVLTKIPNNREVTVVSQTTFSPFLFNEYSLRIKSYFKNAEIINTICQVCVRRMNSYKELALNVDAVIVIGGKNSENTKNMAKFLSKFNKNVKMITGEEDLSREVLEELSAFTKILLCSGTSTPMDKVLAVYDKLKAL